MNENIVKLVCVYIHVVKHGFNHFTPDRSITTQEVSENKKKLRNGYRVKRIRKEQDLK